MLNSKSRQVLTRFAHAINNFALTVDSSFIPQPLPREDDEIDNYVIYLMQSYNSYLEMVVHYLSDMERMEKIEEARRLVVTKMKYCRQYFNLD